MNAIAKALNDIKYTIPAEVLNIGFIEKNNRINQIISLDERIMSAVIRPRVLVDANLVGGVTTKIELSKCNVVALGNTEFIIEVPKALTNNKSIVSALSLVSLTLTNQASYTQDMSPIISSGINMMNNLGTENIIQTSRLEIIGDNTILVQDPSVYLTNGMLRCVIENNSNLENINPRSYLSFSKLVILAIKSYLYNHLKIKLDQGYIYGGHELSSVTDVIDSYADSEELYQEYLNTVWRKVSYLNDSASGSRYIKAMFGNTI